MPQVKLRADGSLRPAAALALAYLLLVVAAAPAFGQEDQGSDSLSTGDKPRTASWLWDWSDPYHPQTTLLWGGSDLFFCKHGKLREPSTADRAIILNLEARSVREVMSYRGKQFGPALPMSIDLYRTYLTSRSLRTHWNYYSRQGLARAAGQGAPIGTLKLELPVDIPKPIQKIIGRGKPNLRVSGSETITISGQSRWEVDRKETEAGRQSKFPQLNLKQQLAVNVSGDIGDKINVDIDQNSQESLANRIRINYRGYEDEILQTLDLGNTNLSLPGAQFVSYNGRHQGLFGVKANARLGDLDLTVIASKQEGQSGSNRFVGSSTVRATNISDVDYSTRTFYFLGDPREWPFDIDLRSLEIYVDDRNSGNNNQDGPTIPGKAYVYTSDSYPSTPAEIGISPHIERSDTVVVNGDFDMLTAGEDYDIVYFYEGCPTIWLARSLAEREVLAVAYFDSTIGAVGNTADVDTLELRLLKAPSTELGTTGEGFYDPQGPFYPTVRYEMKNVYNLGASDILAEGFTVEILPKSGDAYDYTLNGIPYTQLLGLDRLDQNGFSAFRGGGADGEIDVEQGSVFLSLGLMIYPDLRPFAPDEVDTLFWRPLFFPEGVCGNPSCTEPALYPPLTGRNATPAIYDRKNVKRNEDTIYGMTVEFRSSLYGETIFLQGNVLEGSETVIANGQRLERGRDYKIDYETGAVTLLSDVARESAADITIDYSYKPLFALGQRTLLGFSSSYTPVEDYALSTTWIYESKGATERRPKLGEEPSLTVIGDLAGSLRKTPAALTRFVDGLPFISTDSRSSINLAGEVGMSFPNPNTKNHGYVDDFEGSRDDFSVDLSRLRWFYSSLPEGKPSDPAFKGPIRWYNPREERRVRADDLQPDLESVEADDTVESIEFDYTPRNGDSRSWAGVTQLVSVAGADFSQKQFIEFWVNDEFTDSEGVQTFFRDLALNPDSARIHIDVGTVSEDAYWNIQEEPNGVLDTEDQNGDQQLDDSEILMEDTGLDGILSPDETGETQTGVIREGDPHGDDYFLKSDLSDINSTKFESINGTEDNDRLDTEDLNKDGQLNQLVNSYYRYSVNLADPDSRFLLTEVTEAGLPTGWRRYRIPVRGGGIDTTVGSPSLDSVEHVRVWFTGFSTRSRIQIAKMTLTGNRWTRQGIADTSDVLFSEEELEARGEKFLVGVANNKEDLDYVPPFDPGEDGTIKRREQSLLLTYANLEQWHRGLAFRAFDPAKDFTLYREIKFYVYGDQTTPDLDFFVRFGDQDRYYQIELPVRMGWQEVVVDLQRLTSLKSPDIPDSVVVGERRYSVVGAPRFTQIRRITVGLTNRGSMPASGEVWFNDIRLGAVRRDIGIASRVNMQMSLADFMNLSANFDGQDEDFLAIGQNRGSGIDVRRMSLGGKVNLHKLVEPLHLTLPVSFNWSENSSVPQFRTGDDRELLESQIGEERSVSRNTSFSADLARSPSRNFFLRYTIDAVRASVQWRKNRAVTPVKADTNEVVTTRVRYDLTPPQKRVKLMPGLDLSYLPSNFSASFVTTAETRSSFDKEAGVQTKNVTLKPAKFQLDAGYRPVSSLAGNYSLSSSRDLLRKRPVEFLNGLNIGSEISRQENIRANFSPRVFWWLGQPSFNYSGSYNENHNPALTTEQDREIGETRRNVSNSSSYRMGLNLPWGRFMGIFSGAGGDSVSAISPLAWTKGLFGLLGGFSHIDLSRTVTDRSSYTGVYGVPSLHYKFGLGHDLGPESRPAPSGSLSLQASDKTEASTNGALFKDYKISVAYMREDRDNESTSGTTYDRVISWPDVKFEVSRLESKLKLTALLMTLSAQSSYSGTNNKNVSQGGKQKSLAEAKNWSPLVSVNAIFKGGLSTTFSASKRNEERTTFNASVAQSRAITTAGYSLNLQKTIRAGKGISLPFGKQTASQKTINLSVNVTYNTNKSARTLGTGAVLVDSDNDKLRAVGRTTYSFSSNMQGTLEMSFDQTRNKKVRRTMRAIGMNASVMLRF